MGRLSDAAGAPRLGRQAEHVARSQRTAAPLRPDLAGMSGPAPMLSLARSLLSTWQRNGRAPGAAAPWAPHARLPRAARPAAPAPRQLLLCRASTLRACAASGRKPRVAAAAAPPAQAADPAAALQSVDCVPGLSLEEVLQRVRRALALEQPVDAEVPPFPELMRLRWTCLL